jgi:hypothetical protein
MDAQLKATIRAELFRCAIAGQFQTYTQFFNRIDPGTTMGNFPYQEHLKDIAQEEQSLGYPDITFMVHAVDGLPHWIAGRDASNPDAAQIDFLKKGADEVIKLYCPAGTKNPY